MILGISTNTRLIGLAIINPENSLVDYSIRLYKSSWSPSKANMIVTSCLEPCVRQYCIKRAVLSIPRAHHQTKEFRELVNRIREYFKGIKIPVYEKDVSQLHAIWPQEQKKTKKVLMQALTLQYPQLTLCYHKELRNKRRYYIKVFEAVGAATLHAQEN